MVRMIDLFRWHRRGQARVRAGYSRAETVFASEWDPKAAETYSLNFPTPMVSGRHHGDFRRRGASVRHLPAGFPCQAFSVAGRRMGFDDSYKGMSRGTPSSGRS